MSACLLCFLLSLVCKIRSGTTELSKPVGITVEVNEGKVEGRYSIDGKAEMPGFTFVVRTSHSRVSESQHDAGKQFSCSFSWRCCSSAQIPNITEIQPNYGPRIGGTLITVTGPHLDAGKTRKVTLNDVPCPIKRSANRSLSLSCLTC